MNRMIALMVVVAAWSASASAQECSGGTCRIRQRTVIRSNVTVSGGGAQAHADHLAATGSFSHASNCGGYEGLGFSTTSPDAACRRACYWGQRPVREIGTAWCPRRRGWVAVVRYR